MTPTCELLTERDTKSDFYQIEVDLSELEDRTEHILAETMPWAKEQIEPLLEIKDNWDGYGAIAPQKDLAVSAIFLLSILRAEYYISEPSVNPTRTGGVNMEWEVDSRNLEIETGPADTISYLYKNSKNKERESGLASLSPGENLPAGLLLALKKLF